MDYLNQDHPVLRQSEALRSFAVRELLERALGCSHSFRLQFDRQRLERVIGRERFFKLMPNYSPGGAPRPSNYDVHQDYLDPEKAETLRQLLSPEGDEGYPERPLNAIKSVRLLDREGRTVLRGGDRNDFILFDLADAERAALLEAFRQRNVPADVIEKVEVDVERLEP